jgi:hypothetical protein
MVVYCDGKAVYRCEWKEGGIVEVQE